VRTLIAGVGNIFWGDDGFGSALAQRLATESLPEGVRVIDFGIGEIHLALELFDGYDELVLLDAVPNDEPPGTVVVIEPETIANSGTDLLPDPHGLGPVSVLELVARLDARPERCIVVGCTPRNLGEGIGLSEEVQEALEPAAAAVRRLLEESRAALSS
jgi:hydrogenase maturation protease